jgi:hypothetical protein
VRVEGPTPRGGVVALGYYDEHGHLAEVVEFDSEGCQIARTYTMPSTDSASTARERT